jgi:hypothetical protein
MSSLALTSAATLSTATEAIRPKDGDRVIADELGFALQVSYDEAYTSARGF